MQEVKTYKQLQEEIEILNSQLSEAHEIIGAISRGEVDGFVVKNEDKHHVYTLKTADTAYRIFIEKMAEGAVTIDENGIITYCNSRFAKMLNTPLENVIGFSLEKFIPADSCSIVTNLIKNVWENGEAKAEILLPDEEGELPVLLSMTTLQMEESPVISCIATDLSLQKEAQKQKLVMDKKNEFISIASHELKTPVTSIKGYVQLLKHNFQNENNSMASGLLSRVDAQVSKLTTLISDLLDVSKMENGRLQYNEDRFDFNELVKEVIEDSKMNFGEYSINSTFAKSAFVSGDRNKIAQVITNFINNAAKYSPKSTAINIETKREGDEVYFEVSDKGIGISNEMQSKIFERFYRVTGKNESTYSGLGLGLYISSEIIKRHNGTIGVNSKEGEGSAFYFKLPVSN